MWRLPQQLWIGPVLERVARFTGDEWSRCEWCGGRPGFAVRHDDGSWQSVCLECAEPWLQVPVSFGLRGAAMNLGGFWWFWDSPGRSCGVSDRSTGWAGSGGSGESVGGVLLVVEAVLARWSTVVDGGSQEARLEEPVASAWSGAMDMFAAAAPSGAPGLGVGDERDSTWDNADEAIQLQNALRDEGRKRGYGRWHNLEGLAGRFRRLRAFSFGDLWSAATLAHRNGTRRFDCYWEENAGGSWDVYVILKAEHERNREGR